MMVARPSAEVTPLVLVSAAAGLASAQVPVSGATSGMSGAEARMRYEQRLAQCNVGTLPAPDRMACVRNAGQTYDLDRAGQPAPDVATTNDGRATVMSTSTRNFPNRLGKNTNVYLGSAELSAICSKLGRIPSKEEYLADMGVLNQNGDKVYKYLNFDQIAEFKDVADGVTA